jgi:hypothetical protein
MDFPGREPGQRFVRRPAPTLPASMVDALRVHEGVLLRGTYADQLRSFLCAGARESTVRPSDMFLRVWTCERGEVGSGISMH